MFLQVRHDYDEPDFTTIDTLFSLAEAHLFMQLVELFDSKPGVLPATKTYADMYRLADCSGMSRGSCRISDDEHKCQRQRKISQSERSGVRCLKQSIDCARCPSHEG